MARKKEELTKGQVNEVINFVSEFYNSYSNSRYQFASKSRSFSSPYTQNEEEKRKGKQKISTKPSQDEIDRILFGNDGNYGSPQSYSEFFSLMDSIYSNTIKYISGLLSFDLNITCKNIKDANEYKSNEYLEDLNRVYRFLDNFDYKHEFTKVFKNLIKDGVDFVWFRDSKCTYSKDENALEKNERRSFTLQQMPQDRCLITNIYNKGEIGYDFDIGYFDGNIDINLYDNTLVKAKGKSKNGDYIPSSTISHRNGIYSDYIQTSPVDGAYCFKIDDETLMINPPLTSLMRTLIDNDDIRALQKDKNMLGAYYLLAGEIGTMTTKSGDKANQTKFTPEVLGELLSLVTSGLKENVKAIAMPSENIRGWQYNDQNPSMSNNQFEQSSALGVSASKLIYNTDTVTQSVIQNAILNDYNYWKKIYYQFNRFLEYYVNMKTKKYEFAFRLDGSNYHFEREHRRKAINELATLGLTLNSSAWASVYGYEPQEFERMLKEAHFGNMQDNLTLLMNKNIDTQDSMQDNKQDGRPTLNEADINDSGEVSRDDK